MNIDWGKYDFVHLGVSGGKDSTAALLWLVRESGCPVDRISVSFCDTGNEHAITYAYIAELSKCLHHIETIKPPLDFYQLAKKKGRFPSTKARFCTQEFKIFPSQKYIASLPGNGLLLSGVRAAESSRRRAMKQFDFDDYYACDILRPLFDWSLSDVWDYLKRWGVPRNALYDYGAQRVGCLPCIMSRKAEIKMIAENFPERIDLIRKWELLAGRISSFYAQDKVPAAWRSREITTADGRVMRVPTIDDVAGWSKTARGGAQYALDFYEPMLCNSKLGACE